MKKYIAMAVAVVAVFGFTACSNDDIEVQNMVNVTVNPSGVIAPFTYEVETGELEAIPSSYKIRTRVLAYTEEGALKVAETAYLNDYASLMSVQLPLAKGTYNLIAITDLVRYDGSEATFEYWKMTGEESLSALKLTDTGYIGYDNKILGIARVNVAIGSGTQSVQLNPRPAGALLLTYYRNIHAYNDVKTLELWTNRSCDYMSFDSDGNYVTVPESSNNDYKWRSNTIDTEDFTSANVYVYSFIFPMNKVSYRFVYFNNNDEYAYLTPAMTTSLKAGDEYLFLLNLKDADQNDEITYNYGVLNSGMAKGGVTEYHPQGPETFNAANLGTAKVLDLLKYVE